MGGVYFKFLSYYLPMNVNEIVMSWRPLIYTIIFAVVWAILIIIEMMYQYRQQYKQSTSLQRFVEETVNSIENAITTVSTKNGKAYHVRWALWRQWSGVFWDIDFDVSISIGKNNQISVSSVETWIGASLQEKMNSTHRIKFALSSSRKKHTLHQQLPLLLCIVDTCFELIT